MWENNQDPLFFLNLKIFYVESEESYFFQFKRKFFECQIRCFFSDIKKVFFRFFPHYILLINNKKNIYIYVLIKLNSGDKKL